MAIKAVQGVVVTPVAAGSKVIDQKLPERVPLINPIIPFEKGRVSGLGEK